MKNNSNKGNGNHGNGNHGNNGHGNTNRRTDRTRSVSHSIGVSINAPKI